MKLFNSYVRGGIEWLYEQFTSGATTRDEYIAKIYDEVKARPRYIIAEEKCSARREIEK